MVLPGVSSIPLEEFYPFGESAGDMSIGRTLDGSSPVLTLRRSFPFYGRNYFTLAVNNNGHISFEVAVGAYDPVPFPLNGTKLIAPFWADADTELDNGGAVWYRESTSQADLDRAQREVRRAFDDSFTPSLVFIATWDHIGYYLKHTDKTNTFQCVLVSDGFMSYTIFLYADDLIQWTTSDASRGVDGLGGNQAHVGINAGDGKTFITHEYSFTSKVINITSSRVPENGVDRNGVLVYRVDSVAVTRCEESAELAELNLTPGFGNQLGGTPVLIRGLCFVPGDIILCTFGGTSTVEGVLVNSKSAMCTTPIMNTVGTVAMTLKRLGPASRHANISTTFTSVSAIRAHQVGFSMEDSEDEMQLYFKPNDVVQLTWLPREVVPNYLHTNPDTLKVNIQMFQMIDMPTPRWIPIKGSLMSNLDNRGMAQFTIPGDVTLEDCINQNKLCPVVFTVSAANGTMVRVFGNPEDEVVLPNGQRIPETGIWTSVAYLQTASTNEGELSQQCIDWASNSGQNEILESALSRIPACPLTLAQARADSRYREEFEVMDPGFSDHVTGYADAARRFYSPQSSTCYLEVLMDPDTRASQQCCYGNAGALATGQPGGGSVDRSSPLTGYSEHILNDLLPYAICCRGGRRCPDYDRLRPSNNALSPPYRLPVPACVFGDPHIVTLDGHKYTFNGKGEFMLVETHDGNFTLQGRMEEATADNVAAATGTVFTAIVAHQAGGAVERTVEFQVSQGGDLDVLVDGNAVNFAALAKQDFQQVVVIHLGNNTAVAGFSGGSNIEIRVQNSIISVMLVTLPNHYRSLTRGLMGNYNDDVSDDLITKDSSINIPVNSSAEEIFAFGNTWMISNASESRFAYDKPGADFEAFQDDRFQPIFVPVFDDPVLEQKADEICGDDEFCRFDIAATKNEDIGLSTMVGIKAFDVVVALAEPIVCEPQCEIGVCVDTNTCACSVGFSGETCDEKLVSECDVDMCQNNAKCVQHVGSFTCNCPEGFIGIFCQERGYHTENALVGFEERKYEFPESSNPQICLSVSGTVNSNFSVVVNTHQGIADESDYTPLHHHSISISPSTWRSRTCFTVFINNDRSVESNETFTITLQESASGLRSGIRIDESNNGTILKVIDNDLLLDCRSFLRFTRPHLFHHCLSCTYSPSSWANVPNTRISMPLGYCISGAAHTKSRTQTAPEPGCVVKTERQQMCILTQPQRLVHTFNMGIPNQRPDSHGRMNYFFEPLTTPITPPTPLRGKRQTQSRCSPATICQDVSTTPRNCTKPEVCRTKHGNKCPQRSMVFVLDTSGSIREKNFQRMTTAISDFVPLLCDNMKVAIISHSEHINIEFCFNCHNLCHGCPDRRNVSKAIQGINYRSGGTHTGVATRCVYDRILDPTWGCGVDTSTDCLDIIYVTDGRSNGPLDPCAEATCLKNHPTWCGRVNMYAIAIGSRVNTAEIKCITQNDEDSVFNVGDFAEFEKLVKNAYEMLEAPSSKYHCVKQTDSNILL